MSTLPPLVSVPVRYPMITWFTGDVFDRLATLDDGSIDLVVTSPPFLALRSYLPADHPDKDKEIGSEATPAEFLDVMLRVTAELRRVLAPHGSIAVELGDTYAGSGGAGGDYDPGGWREGQETYRQPKYDRVVSDGFVDSDGRKNPRGIVNLNDKKQGGGQGWPLAKSKTLIPELYRIALAYGFNPLTGQPSPAGRWRVRNVVTWCRPNPPVGALGDKWRPATSDVVVACVSGKRYWDDLATRRPFSEATLAQNGRLPRDLWREGRKDNAEPLTKAEFSMTHSGAPLLDYWEIPLLDDEEPRQYGPKERPPRVSPGGSMHDHSMDEVSGLGAKGQRFLGGEWVNEAGAPLLDYWEIPPTGYAGAHYAVYPPALVEPLVKAMVPERVCRTCGEPSIRIVETSYKPEAGRPPAAIQNAETKAGSRGRGEDKLRLREQNAPAMANGRASRIDQTVGFTDCGHDDWRPGIVLDPFAGSGTTLAVASGHGHDAIGFDIDPRNEELARERVGPLLWQEV